MPKVSVIMSSFNHAPFVRAAIDSVFAQSFTDLELVVTDDGSRDGTVDAIRAVRDPRLKFHAFPENRGACVAANDAIDRAGGPYIAMLNSDDYFLPGKIARQVEFLDTHPEIGAVFGRPQFVDERGRPFRNRLHSWAGLFEMENRPRREWLRHFFFERNCLCHPTVLLRRECYERVGRFDPLLMQLPDLDLWVRLCQVYEIHVLPEPLTAFRVLHRERNTSLPSRERVARSAWEMATILGHYARLPDDDLRALFGAAGPAAAPPPVLLARAALQVAKPGYAPFGCALLRECLRADPAALSAAEYFRLVGESDPFGAEFFGREYQTLRASGAFRAARRAAQWWRSQNFHG